MQHNPGVSRRRMLQAALACLASIPFAVRAQQRVPIADMHCHYGMITRKLAESGFADDMRTQRVAIVAWKLVADGRWIRRTSAGIEQVSDPAPGELANFLEGRLENLDSAYEKGLRHLQFVHYTRTPVGDFQTARPVHNGLSEMGRRLVEACNARGILVDLAHSTAASVDQALEIAKAPLVWSHGWVDSQGGDWRDQYGFLSRRLSLAQAKKIAARGGVVGLWGLGLSRPAFGWSVGPHDTRAYAREFASLVNKLGADHVALGTDIEGVGPNWAVNSY